MNKVVEQTLFGAGIFLIGFGLGMKAVDTKVWTAVGEVYEDPFEPEKDDEVIGKLPPFKEAKISSSDGEVLKGYKISVPEESIKWANSIEIEEDKLDYEKYRNITNNYHKEDLEDISVPYIIDPSDYYHGYTDYAKIELSYYDEDDVLTDERDNPIIDPDGTIGEDTLSRFGELSGDDDIVYVRNLQRECDYEIIRLHTSYQKEVLGVEDDMVDKKFMYTRKEVLEE